MRIPLKEFINKPKTERQAHIDLSSPCDEYGCTHSDYRAVLAWHLNTTCDRMGRKTGICCHACNNRKCGNPLHLYWGTQKENMEDLRIHQPDLSLRITKSILDKDPDHFKKMGTKGGDTNKLDESVVQSRIQDISHLDKTKRGWLTEISKIWGISHAQSRRFVNKYIKNIST